MKRATLSLVLVGAIAPGAAELHAQSQRPELAIALQQVEQGEFDAALLGLDGIIKKLGGTPGATKDLAQAYLFQGIAYVGLEQTEKARASFRQALALDPAVTLNRERFAPKIVQVFEEVRQAASPKKKGKTGLILLGGAALAGAGAAVALSGGGGNPEVVTVVDTVSGTLAAGVNNLDCRPNVHGFSMGRAGGVSVNLQSQSVLSAALLGFLCVGNVSAVAGSDCVGVNLALPGQLRREMAAGSHSLIVTRPEGGGCTVSRQYVINVSHPR